MGQKVLKPLPQISKFSISGVGMISVSIFSTVAVLFYYGCQLIRDTNENYQPGYVIIVKNMDYPL